MHTVIYKWNHHCQFTHPSSESKFITDWCSVVIRSWGKRSSVNAWITIWEAVCFIWAAWLHAQTQRICVAHKHRYIRFIIYMCLSFTINYANCIIIHFLVFNMHHECMCLTYCTSIYSSQCKADGNCCQTVLSDGDGSRPLCFWNIVLSCCNLNSDSWSCELEDIYIDTTKIAVHEMLFWAPVLVRMHKSFV